MKLLEKYKFKFKNL